MFVGSAWSLAFVAVGFVLIFAGLVTWMHGRSPVVRVGAAFLASCALATLPSTHQVPQAGAPAQPQTQLPAQLQLSGGTYVGAVANGKASGSGTLAYHDGTKYVGEFRDNKKNGHGTMAYSDGTLYVAEFKDDRMTGAGTMTKSDGSKYVGEFENGMPVNGIATGPDGTTEFRRLTNPDGSNYAGMVVDGKANGLGQLSLPDGSKYIGNVVGGKPSGPGRLTLANGTTYVGEFRNGTLASGIQRFADGVVREVP